MFPPVCPLCEKTMAFSRVGYACETCQPKIEYIKGATCMKCGKQLLLDEKEYCSLCKKSMFHFKRGFVTFLYEGNIRDMLLKFKYKGRRDLGLFFANASLDKFEEELRSLNLDAVIPIPVHKDRLKKRGYNQAEVFGNLIADALGIPCYGDLLVRKKATVVQKELDTRGRLANLMDAFSVNEAELRRITKKDNSSLKRIILVDDIFTTGSTIEASTLILMEVGIEEAYALCVASSVGY